MLAQILVIIAVGLALYGAVHDTRRLRDADPFGLALATGIFGIALGLGIF